MLAEHQFEKVQDAFYDSQTKRSNMKNIDWKVEGENLVITVDMSKRLGISKSGKSEMVASTEGNKHLKDGIFMGINIYKKIEEVK